MSFLKAEWRKLAIANYEVNPEILQKHLPAGTELDLWEGKCYVSLIGFMFLNTKVLGVKVPFHTNFEEVNLRFYVTRNENGILKRGVVFIKEIVPKFWLACIANTLYKEHYESLKMNHEWSENSNNISVTYRWRKAGIWHSFQVEAPSELHVLENGSEAEFITEHYWGYAKIDDKTSNEYEVKHPKWKIYKVSSFAINVNFATVYGNEFGFLNNVEPCSVMLAEGSEVIVENKNAIKI